tara:strand:- start:147 stop:341 length:195 start_codon:yes stop_codon:yes gene_type:complete
MEEEKMNYKLIIGLWVMLSVSLVYWNINRHKDNMPLSECHLAEIKWYYEKPMCTECKLFCEVKK